MDFHKTQVALHFNVARCAKKRLIQRSRATESVADRPRAGAPRVTSRRLVRHLRNRFFTASSTARVIMDNRGRPINRTTMANRLRSYGAGDPIEDCCLDVSIERID